MTETVTPEEAAEQFYQIVKARKPHDRGSPIFAIHLSSKGYVEKFSQQMQHLAEKDSLNIVILRHRDLTPEDQQDAENLSTDTASKHKPKNRTNTIYIQLQEP
jgi:hypothetical protein